MTLKSTYRCRLWVTHPGNLCMICRRWNLQTQSYLSGADRKDLFSFTSTLPSRKELKYKMVSKVVRCGRSRSFNVIEIGICGSLSDTRHYWCNRYRPKVREISGRSLLWYQSDWSFEPRRQRCTIIDNCFNKNRCEFNSTLFFDILPKKKQSHKNWY